MKVLQIHNFYQNPGGEDQALAAEYSLLTSRGHFVEQYLAHNDAIHSLPRIQVSFKTLWNTDAYRELRKLLRRQKPDVVHAHNTFPLISPAVYYAAAAEGVPIVQSLHNYRLLCAGGALFRDGGICEECVGAVAPYKAIVHKCYRNNRAASTVLVTMVTGHRILGTWKNKVDKYIAITRFSKDKFVAGGLPAEKIAIKPHFLAQDPGIGEGSGGYALFVGRLSEEKGIRVLLEAWQHLEPSFPLKIAGDGPLGNWVRERASSLPGVEALGFCTRDQVIGLMQNAAFVILPSTCYEHLSMTLIESLGCGTPVLASDLGTMKESIVDGVNGYHFRPGDSVDLADHIHQIRTNPSLVRELRKSARASYEQHYTASRNYILLMDLYKSVILTYKRASTPSLSN